MKFTMDTIFINIMTAVENDLTNKTLDTKFVQL